MTNHQSRVSSRSKARRQSPKSASSAFHLYSDMEFLQLKRAKFLKSPKPATICVTPAIDETIHPLIPSSVHPFTQQSVEGFEYHVGTHQWLPST